jgi:hypothetical protein
MATVQRAPQTARKTHPTKGAGQSVNPKENTMNAWGITIAEARQIANNRGLRVDGQDMTPGRGGVSRCSFTLKLDTDSRREDGSLPYQRVSLSGNGRRVAAVCWHGHRDIMRDLFQLHPDARLKSALADYRGAQDFEEKHLDTQGSTNHWNVGLSYGEACVCFE